MRSVAPAPAKMDLAPLRARLSGARGARFWRSLEEVADTPAFRELVHREFPSGASEWLEGHSRRNFLGLMGASLALAGLTSCTRQPIEKIVPYVTPPEELVLGKPLFFATAMTLGGFATGLLVESHEGHPTKIEGNPGHPMSLGATNVFHQAALLDLYDPDRSQAVLNGGAISSWEAFLASLHAVLLVQQPKQGAGLRLLTETVTSPTLHAQIRSLLERFPQARWHQFEPLNRDQVRTGSRRAFGEVVEAQYDFRQAKVILSLDADFLFAHPAAVRYAREFSERRRVRTGRPELNRLYVVEPTPSVTGSNADHRLPLRAAEIEELAWVVARELGAVSEAGSGATVQPHAKWIAALVNDLRQNRGTSLVIAGEQQPAVVHVLAHAMNQALGNVGQTVRYTATAEVNPVNQLESLRQWVEDLKAGVVDLLVILGGNPVFTAPADLEFARHLSQARLRVHLSPEVNETSALCQWHLPQTHFLESWSDARAYDGTVSIVQPLILPLYGGKSVHELIEAMLQPPGRSDYEIVRDHWQAQNLWPDFEQGWRRALHDGLIAGTALPQRQVSLRSDAIAAARAGDLEGQSPMANGPSSTVDRQSSGADGHSALRTPHSALEFELHFRPDPTVWDGRFANNGWLQELPKPLSKLTWDNAALISPATAARFQLANGDLVQLELQRRVGQAPVWIAPGQAENAVTLHLGYGRTHVGRVGQGAGFNAYTLRTSEALHVVAGVKLIKTGERYPLAGTQTHHAIDSEERQILPTGTWTRFLTDPGFLRHRTESPQQDATLFKPEEHRYDGPNWGMAIDLTACLGCNACVLACQAENNIPVVGKAQVAVHREMHWLRLDTYYHGGADNPAMSHQPVPCMHCENAPCELVCPVGATLHDKEGLNLQVYNRCIGTRYCSNNCPYKVRRFNFLQYADYETPSLTPMRNPNVTVRWRGVMEKCTYCIQRISAARIQAKTEDRPIRDGEIRTACQQVCPAEAIVFGDIRDPNSRVAQLKALPLGYSMLGELNARPRTTYLAKLRNPHPELETPQPSPTVESSHA